MKLYYLKGACSLASLISLTEAGISFEAIKVDRKTRRAADGENFPDVNPKDYVPALRLDDGEVLTENAALLPYIAELNPAARLAPPPGTRQRYRLQEWLGYISSEVHKNFSPLFNSDVPDAYKQMLRTSLARRLGYIETRLGTEGFLLGPDFTVADAYLWVVLSWRDRVAVDISALPRLTAYFERIRARPAVQKALQLEGLAA